ncbi:learning-associated protein domain-containing protein [Phthorimaea operculella]|nr:learning-associated protein domain-containing protein [Phthorimaea operculella]
MAKSIRSKWKRKCRAIKRERYAVKELARLKKMLGIKEEDKPAENDEKVEVEGEDGKKRVYSSKTLKDQNGQYPVWLHKRKIAKMNKVGKKNAKKRSKKRRR